MKRIWKYIIIVTVTVILTVMYGFFVGGEMPLWFAFGIFTSSTIVLVFFERKPSNKKLFGRIMKIIVTSVIMLALSIGLYGTINESSGNLIRRYETEIIDVHFSGGRISFNEVYLFFYTPDGEECSVEIYSETPPSKGTEIIIDEYEGLFRETFYRYQGTVK